MSEFKKGDIAIAVHDYGLRYPRIGQSVFIDQDPVGHGVDQTVYVRIISPKAGQRDLSFNVYTRHFKKV